MTNDKRGWAAFGVPGIFDFRNCVIPLIYDLSMPVYGVGQPEVKASIVEQ